MRIDLALQLIEAHELINAKVVLAPGRYEDIKKWGDKMLKPEKGTTKRRKRNGQKNPNYIKPSKKIKLDEIKARRFYIVATAQERAKKSLEREQDDFIYSRIIRAPKRLTCKKRPKN